MLSKYTHTCQSCLLLINENTGQHHFCCNSPSVVALKDISLQDYLFRLAISSQMSVVPETDTTENIPQVNRNLKRKGKQTRWSKNKRQKLSKGLVAMNKSNKHNIRKIVGKNQVRPISLRPSISSYSIGDPQDLQFMSHIIYVDIDNCSQFFELLPCCLPEKTFYWLFIGGLTQWDEPRE